MKYSVALVAVFAGFVAAQSGTSSAADPTGTGGVSTCIADCSQEAATENCGSTPFTDPACACENTAFQQAALQCLQANCTAAEQQQALQLQSALCGASGSASGTASEPAATETDTEAVTGTEASTPAATATAPGSSSRPASTGAASSSRATSAAGSTSRTASVTAGATSGAASSNAAGLPAVFDLTAAGAWAAVALGGAVVAQFAL